MGIFNMMIVIPMLLIAVTMPLYYDAWLGGDARNAISMAGVLLLAASFSVLWVREPSAAQTASSGVAP
jgi:maltose/moltooligosaccharide transporter